MVTENYFRAIMQTAVDPIIVISDKGIIEQFNVSAERVFGYDAEQVIGQNVNMLMPAEHAVRHDGYINNYLESDVAQIIGKGREVKGLRRDGNTFPMYLAISEIKHSSGNRSFAGIVRDLSEQKSLEAKVEQTQQSLMERENYFRAVMQTAVDPIIVISDKGIIEQFNASAERVFGYDAEQAIGQNVSMLMPSEHAVRHDGYINNYLESGVARIIGKGREVTGLRSDGRTFPMYLAISEIKHLSGSSSFAGIVRDLTRQKALESELARAHKLEAVGQLAAGIAHEINTPAQFVGDNIHFLGDAFKDLNDLIELHGKLVTQYQAGEDPGALLEQIKVKTESIGLDYLFQDIPESIDQSSEGIGRISEIVRAMKEFSLPGQRDRVSIDLNKAIETTIVVARNEWKFIADMVTELDPDLPMLECRSVEINQAILNIVINAAQAIEERRKAEDDSSKGTITIKTSKEEGFLVISIADTGCGIREEDIASIFNPFFTTKKVGKGSGQGLSISYTSIVDKHRGKIEVDSKLGVGTTFTIKLPTTL